jgi:hypothetical protein
MASYPPAHAHVSAKRMRSRAIPYGLVSWINHQPMRYQDRDAGDRPIGQRPLGVLKFIQDQRSDESLST